MKEQDYIYEVFLERSFSKAARKLYVSQPALSMAVKKVEEDLGITVFDRSANPLSLTDQGKIYVAYLEKIRSAKRAMDEQLSDMADLKVGNITVSGENFVSSFILPEVLVRFSEKYPGIQVNIVESNSPDLRQQLLSENTDFLVAHDFDMELYEAKELFEEQVLLSVPDSFPISDGIMKYALSGEDIIKDLHKKAKAVDLNAFSDFPFLLMKPGNDLCKRAALIFEDTKFEPKVRIRLDQMITAYNLSCAGMGITLVSDKLVEKAGISGCRYFVLDSPHIYRQMCIGYKKNRYVNHAAAAFIETALEVYHKEK